jgi:predicted dithiol-disulfide oxidoreductase (DUF899 family)
VIHFIHKSFGEVDLGRRYQPAKMAALRALALLQAYKRRMGWTFPWASSLGSIR